MNKFKEINLASEPKMFLSNNFVRNVKTLHEHIGKTEWSGFLLCKIDGSIEDLDNLQVIVENVYPCNIGTAAFTSYAHADHMDSLEELFPEYGLFAENRWNGKEVKSGYKIQQIHTHHNMNTFFSGTDMQDLHDNTENFGFYISLIVNFQGNYKAKGSFMSKVKTNTTLSLTDFPVNLKLKEEKEALIIVDFDIDNQEPQWLLDRISELDAINKARKVAQTNKTGIPKGLPNSYRPTVNLDSIYKNHLSTEEEPTLKCKYFQGFGNVYTDEMGHHFDDSGDSVDEDLFKLLVEENEIGI